MNSKAVRATRARRTLAADNAAQPVERFHAKMARLQAAAKRARRPSDDLWCILQTTPGRTLRLALSLTESGFEAWTPCETKLWQRPRSSKKVERDMAILPTFVFVRADREVVDDLLRTLALPINPHPPFAIFRHAGRVPLLTGISIARLREGEEAIEATRRKRLEREHAAALRKQRSDFRAGQTVKVTSGAFAGFTGAITGTKGRDAEVEIMGRSYRIGAWLLVADQVSGASSPEDMAARAA